MRKNREGETVGEQIINYLDTLKKKRLSLLIDDAFYEKTNEKGIYFYVRKHNNLRDIKFIRPLENEKKTEIKISKKDNKNSKENEKKQS